MAQSNRSALVLAGMIIAAIYVIMVIGFTRSTYFIGGHAFERAALAPYTLAAGRSVPAPAHRLCSAPEINAAEPRDCVLAAPVASRSSEPPPL